MIAIDPEETDGAIPANGDLARRGAVCFDFIAQAGLREGAFEIVEGGAGGVEVGIGFAGGVVGVDADDLAEVEGGGDGGDADGGFTFEAADFDVDATGGGGSGEHAEGAEFTVADVAFDVLCFAPGGVDDGVEIGWEGQTPYCILRC